MPLIPSLIAYPAAVVGARIAGGALGSGVGSGVSYAINSLIKSDYWLEQTQKDTYTAPEGHIINAEPTYLSSGQGRVKILNRN